METFEPLDDNKLTKKYREYALVFLMFPTEKLYGIIKSRTCDDGRKYWYHIKKDDVYPAVSLEAIIIN